MGCWYIFQFKFANYLQREAVRQSCFEKKSLVKHLVHPTRFNDDSVFNVEQLAELYKETWKYVVVFSFLDRSKDVKKWKNKYFEHIKERNDSRTQKRKICH